MPTKSKALLDDLLDHFTDSVDFGSDPKLRERQSALYDKMREEETHMYDDPTRTLRLAVER